MNKTDVKMIPYIIGNLKREIANATAKRKPVQIMLGEGMVASADNNNYYIVDPITNVVTINLDVGFLTSATYKNINAIPLPFDIRPKTDLIFMVLGGAQHESRLVIDRDGVLKVARTYNIRSRTEVDEGTSSGVLTSVSYISRGGD